MINNSKDSSIVAKVKEEFVWVGCTLYKRVDMPVNTTDSKKILKPWTTERFISKYGRGLMNEIPEYDGFCNIPGHIDYQESYNGFLNRYRPLEYTPVDGDCLHTIAFLQHIFGEQIELGLDYLQLLYLRPLQRLPILLLVSQERNTGKTTFLNFLRTLFGDNVTYNTNESFRSTFNSDWSGKLLICVDEVLLNRIEDSERIKNLSTGEIQKVEAKGKDRVEEIFFGKFVLCSNNDCNPVYIEPGETRYWVRKIPVLTTPNDSLRYTLQEEAPHFLFFLQNRQLSTEHVSRMWFDNKLIQTAALKKIIDYNRSPVEREMIEIFLEIMKSENIDRVEFCVNDIMVVLGHNQVKADSLRVRDILRRWKLPQAANTLAYTAYYPYSDIDGQQYNTERKYGRYYTVTKEFLKQRY